MRMRVHAQFEFVQCQLQAFLIELISLSILEFWVLHGALTLLTVLSWMNDDKDSSLFFSRWWMDFRLWFQKVYQLSLLFKRKHSLVPTVANKCHFYQPRSGRSRGSVGRKKRDLWVFSHCYLCFLCFWVVLLILLHIISFSFKN